MMLYFEFVRVFIGQLNVLFCLTSCFSCRYTAVGVFVLGRMFREAWGAEAAKKQAEFNEFLEVFVGDLNLWDLGSHNKFTEAPSAPYPLHYRFIIFMLILNPCSECHSSADLKVLRSSVVNNKIMHATCYASLTK